MMYYFSLRMMKPLEPQLGERRAAERGASYTSWQIGFGFKSWALKIMESKISFLSYGALVP